MAYNAKNKEIIKSVQLEPDRVYQGVIIDVKDGKVKDFEHTQSWKNQESPAIELTVEVVDGDKSIKIKQIYCYVDEDGKTKISEKSNLGKYNAKYKKLPEVGDQVKILADVEGFGKIMI